MVGELQHWILNYVKSLYSKNRALIGKMWDPETLNGDNWVNALKFKTHVLLCPLIWPSSHFYLDCSSICLKMKFCFSKKVHFPSFEAQSRFRPATYWLKKKPGILEEFFRVYWESDTSKCDFSKHILPRDTLYSKDVTLATSSWNAQFIYIIAQKPLV